MIRAAAVLACLAGPAAADVTRSECIDLLKAADDQSVLILAAREALRGRVNGISQTGASPALPALKEAINTTGEAVDAQMDALLDAIGDLCRDKL